MMRGRNIAPPAARPRECGLLDEFLARRRSRPGSAPTSRTPGGWPSPAIGSQAMPPTVLASPRRRSVTKRLIARADLAIADTLVRLGARLFLSGWMSIRQMQFTLRTSRVFRRHAIDIIIRDTDTRAGR